MVDILLTSFTTLKPFGGQNKCPKFFMGSVKVSHNSCIWRSQWALYSCSLSPPINSSFWVGHSNIPSESSFTPDSCLGSCSSIYCAFLSPVCTCDGLLKYSASLAFEVSMGLVFMLFPLPMSLKFWVGHSSRER